MPTHDPAPAENKRQNWYLRKVPTLAAFPPSALDELASVAVVRERPRKTCLYLAGDIADRVFFLHGGRVSALHVTASTRTINLGLYGPTDVFGEECLWSAAAREHMAVTATAVLYTEVPCARLRALLDDHPAVARLFSEQAITRRDVVIRRLSGVLADQLLELGERGHDTPDGRALAFPLTHDELATLIGTTRETVTLELNRFEREGLVGRRGRQVLLRDLPRLRACASEAPGSTRPRRALPDRAKSPHGPGAAPSLLIANL
jgi:CRP/FNR family cyclic AMP-dependent transcriptional regulator